MPSAANRRSCCGFIGMAHNSPPSPGSTDPKGYTASLKRFYITQVLWNVMLFMPSWVIFLQERHGLSLTKEPPRQTQPETGKPPRYGELLCRWPGWAVFWQISMACRFYSLSWRWASGCRGWWS